MSGFDIKTIDEDQRLVTGVVYAPYVIDTWGTMMEPQGVADLAHSYMRLIRSGAETIDVMHDRVPIDAEPVESYLARAGDPQYREGSWVMTVRINDDETWAAVKAGKLNGFSFEIMAQTRLAYVETIVDANEFGVTEENDGHTHYFFLEFDDDGRVVAGRTSMEKDSSGRLHSHEITRATATQQTNGHAHRFVLDDAQVGA